MEASMHLQSLNPRAAKITVIGPAEPITSAHFRERARHYRLAAALADATRDAQTFTDLAMMFDHIAERFDQAQARAR